MRRPGRGRRGHRRHRRRPPDACVGGHCRRPTGGCWKPWPGRRCWPCASSEAAAAGARRAQGARRPSCARAAVRRRARPAHAADVDQGGDRQPARADLRLSEEDTAELLDTIEESADRLAGLVDNLLDSSRLATGAVQPLLRPVGYDEVVAARSVRMWTRSGARAGSTVGRAAPAVLADARPAGTRGGERAGQRACGTAAAAVSARASAHGAQVELRIVDHGGGLPKGTADSAFAPFQRLAATGTRRRASGSACRWRRGSPRRWAARSAPRTPRAAA